MDRAMEYAEGDEDFGSWLKEVDAIVSAKIPVSVFDLEDMLFRDAFDAGDSPQEFVSDVVRETVGENYGEEYAELLS